MRARDAGLDPAELWGVTSDGATGLAGYLPLHQRWIFYLWRSLGGELAARSAEAAAGLPKRAARAAQRQMRRELEALVRPVLDAADEAAARVALEPLAAHRLGRGLAARCGRTLRPRTCAIGASRGH